MISNFATEIEGTTFELNTMNAERLQLFQVYVLDQGVKKRFHMQMNSQDSRFKIADKEACPEACRHLEAALNQAIFAHYAPGQSTAKSKNT